MAISKDLFLAILSMDAYNRGYNVGISGLGNGPIGNASVDSQSDIAMGSAGVSAGFYAISYNMSAVSGFSAGEKTISYRGTDSLIGSNGFGGDIWNAYGVGAGSPSGSQAKLAIEFYQNVANGADLQTANISLTGHSSGGGLAGLVGGLYGKYGAIFDNMAFEQAALVRFAPLCFPCLIWWYTTIHVVFSHDQTSDRYELDNINLLHAQLKYNPDKDAARNVAKGECPSFPKAY